MAEGMIQASRTRIAATYSGDKADLIAGDIESLSFRDSSFDLIIAAGVIEYLETDEKVLHGLHRILKPGGVLILSVRNKVNLSHLLITCRDLLGDLPVLGPMVKRMSARLSSILSLSPNVGVPGRRHVPWQLKRSMRRVGLEPQDYAFYHFAVLPRLLERRFPDPCVRWEEKLEVLSRTPLGYFANQFLIKARKVSHGDCRA
jgi:SAM-dependent methyltransferase